LTIPNTIISVKGNPIPSRCYPERVNMTVINKNK
jgi:hypothetical protein